MYISNISWMSNSVWWIVNFIQTYNWICKLTRKSLSPVTLRAIKRRLLLICFATTLFAINTLQWWKPNSKHTDTKINHCQISGKGFFFFTMKTLGNPLTFPLHCFALLAGLIHHVLIQTFYITLLFFFINIKT